jgi:hypothetical protein
MKRHAHLIAKVLCVLSVLCVVRSSPAAVIYSGLTNEPIPGDTNGVYLNPLVGTTTVDPYFTTWTFEPWLNPFMGGVYVASNSLLCPVITGVDTIVNLTAGTVIDGSLTFTSSESGSAGHTAAVVTPNKFTLGTPGYLGFKFKPTASSTDTFYGWAQVVFTNTGSGAKIIDWAYDDASGTAIAAGFTGSSVPEPSRAVLLGFGLVGLLMRRQRRAA